MEPYVEHLILQDKFWRNKYNKAVDVVHEIMGYKYGRSKPEKIFFPNLRKVTFHSVHATLYPHPLEQILNQLPEHVTWVLRCVKLVTARNVDDNCILEPNPTLAILPPLSGNGGKDGIKKLRDVIENTLPALTSLQEAAIIKLFSNIPRWRMRHEYDK